MKAFDRNVFEEIQAHARDLKGIHRTRDQEFDEYLKMYLMEFDAEGSHFEDDTVKNTPSPSARNKVVNAMRLMISQDPVFDVKSQGWDETKEEVIEKNISRWWDQAGRAAKRPLHYDMVLSSLLFDEMHTAITVMDDYKKYNKNDRRAERISKMTPILFQSWSPRCGYPEFDELGLCTYYRETKVRWSWVAQKYKDLLSDTYVNKKTTDNVALKVFYDLTHYAIWINDEDPFVCEEHGLPCIPIDVTLTNGTNLFEKEEDKRQPLLFAIKRSRLWERESLLYTVLYSLLFTIGVTPTYVYKTDTEDDLNYIREGGFNYLMMRKGDSFEPINTKGILPPEVQQMTEMTGELIDSSTMYNTAFGEKNNGSQTFSETSLLQQAARLPLIGTQRLGGFGISSTIEMALAMMKEKGLSFNSNGIELKASEIPDDIEIKAKLDVILPQEKLQMVNIGLNMQKLGMPDEWIQNNLMGITNTKELKKLFVKQQAEASMIQYKIQQKIQKIQQKDQEEEQQKAAQLQQAVQAAQQAAAGGPAPMAEEQQPEPQPALTQGQMLEAQMMNSGLNAMDTGQFAENTPGPQTVPGAEMEGGLPGTMGGMIPGQGLAGTPDENGVLR